MKEDNMLKLTKIDDNTYEDQLGICWEFIPEETCEECGKEGCYCSDDGERWCPACIEIQYEVWWL